MLQAALAGFDCLPGCDGRWNFAGESQIPVAGLFGESEVRIAREAGQHPDKIYIQIEELIEGLACLDRSVYRNGGESSVDGRVAIHGRSAGDNARPYGPARVNFIAPRFETLEIAAHVANTGDPEREKHRK